MQPLAGRSLLRRAGETNTTQLSGAAVAGKRPVLRRRPRLSAATNDEGRSTVPEFAPIVSLGGDAYILRSFVRPADTAAPRFDLDLDGALQVQLEALKANNKPYPDHGIEVMYRFAAFDPFERSKYFGRSFDLGQFERFRRVFHTPGYRAILNHDSCEVISKFRMGESKCAIRLLARHDNPEETNTYTITMFQRQGGWWDGYWVTESLTCDNANWDIISW